MKKSDKMLILEVRNSLLDCALIAQNLYINDPLSELTETYTKLYNSLIEIEKKISTIN